jgi:hypothetical protein
VRDHERLRHLGVRTEQADVVLGIGPVDADKAAKLPSLELFIYLLPRCTVDQGHASLGSAKAL